MPHRRQKLTTRLLESLEAGEIARDATVPGLFAEAGTTGAVSLKVQADFRPGPRTGEARKRQTVKVTLGRWPGMTIDAARAEAMRLLAEIKAGRDPRVAPSVAPGVWTVAQLLEQYTADLRIRGKAERTASDMRNLFERYLSDWSQLPANEITRTMARDRHAHVTAKHGPVAANYALRAFRTCFNFAKRVHDSPLGENPAEAVTYHPQRSRQAVILFPDLPSWIVKVRALPNPLRAAMHELALFSGLRPGTLVTLERAWLRFEDRAIVIPAEHMKARREFALPLSGHMIDLVKRALAASDVLFPGAPYLFPTRSHDGERVIPTQVWKEKALPSETGHILRHTYSTVANAAGVTSVDRQLLLAQRVPGIAGVYLQERALFAHLLKQQERVTAYLREAASIDQRP